MFGVLDDDTSSISQPYTSGQLSMIYLNTCAVWIRLSCNQHGAIIMNPDKACSLF